MLISCVQFAIVLVTRVNGDLTFEQPNCGGNVTVSSIPKFIRSPGWEQGVKYPADANCVWHLRTNWDPVDGVPMIKIKINHLELEDDIDCKYDYLEARGHNKKLCGLIKNKEFAISATELVLQFRTDSNYEGRGFEIEASIYIEGCASNVKVQDEELGQINSPMFPQNYPDNIDCWTLISADKRNDSTMRENATISLSFAFIDLEPDDKCAYDYIEIFDGYEDGTQRPGKLLGRFCEHNVNNNEDGSGSSDEEKGSSSGSSSSSSNASNLGSNAESNARESGLARTTSGGNRGVLSNIFVKPRKRTLATALEVVAPVAVSSSSPPAEPLTIRSSGANVLIHFHSDQLLNSKGYKAVYSLDTLQRSRDSSCKWTPNEQLHTINSPNHPANYPPNSDCSVTISAPSTEYKIAVIFDSFHLESDANCSFDRLEVYDLSVDVPTTTLSPLFTSTIDATSIEPRNFESNARRISSVGTKFGVDPRLPLTEPTRTLCGRKSNKFKFLSQSSRLRLRFVSDNYAEYKGFTAHYKFIQNGNVISPLPGLVFTVESDFVAVPLNATVVSGSSHLLNCKPKLNGNETLGKPNTTTVTWIKDDTVITDGVYEAGAKLLIKEFTASSAGRYICKYGNLSREAWLTSKPSACSLLFRKRPRDMILSEGEYAILECNAVTTPSGRKVNIRWEKDGKRIGEEQASNSSKVEQLQNGYLILNGLQSEDSGFYFCVASVVGESGTVCNISAAARLTVNERVNVDSMCGQPVIGQPSRQKPSVDDHGKIVGGQDAQRGAFPWQVMFWDYKRRSFCGGKFRVPKLIIR